MGILKRLKSQLQSSASLSSAVSGKAYSTAAPPAEAGIAAAGDTSTASPLWAPSGSQESHQERQAPQKQPTESPQAQQSAAERAAREVEFHQDKAGLAAAFRTEFSGEQCPEVDLVESDSLTVDAFWSRYVCRNRPVVVLSAVAPDQGWAPGGQWTEAALTSLVGHATISARTRPLADNTFGDVSVFTGEAFAKPYEYESITLAEYFANLHESPPKHYAARLELQEDMPELAGLVPSHYEVPWRRALGVPYKDGVVSYIGAHCQSTPLHYDDLENLMFVLAGFKTVVLFPPSQAGSLYPAPQRLGTHYCLPPLAALDPSSPEAEAWPMAKGARGVTVEVPAGAMLYLPCCWLHAVRGSPALNVTANYWYAQAPKKLDAAVRRQFEERTMHRWVQQLETMGLPASVMREAHEEAPRLVQAKIRMYQDWSWDRT